MKLKKHDMVEASIRLQRDVIEGTADIPDNALVITNPAHLITIFTKKRLELLDIIRRNHPNSVQELADMAHRTKQAVDRDVKILEKYEIIKLVRSGRTAMPIVLRDVVIYKLAYEDVLVANVSVGNVNVNREIMEAV